MIFVNTEHYSISHKICTWFCHAVICFDISWFVVDSCEWFTHILQGYSTGTVAIIQIQQCQWSNPEEHGEKCINAHQKITENGMAHYGNVLYIYRNRKVVRVTALVFTGDVEACLQHLQWISGLSLWRYFHFSIEICRKMQIYDLQWIIIAESPMKWFVSDFHLWCSGIILNDELFSTSKWSYKAVIFAGMLWGHGICNNPWNVLSLNWSWPADPTAASTPWLTPYHVSASLLWQPQPQLIPGWSLQSEKLFFLWMKYTFEYLYSV